MDAAVHRPNPTQRQRGDRRAGGGTDGVYDDARAPECCADGDANAGVAFRRAVLVVEGRVAWVDELEGRGRVLSRPVQSFEIKKTLPTENLLEDADDLSVRWPAALAVLLKCTSLDDVVPYLKATPSLQPMSSRRR